MAEHDPPWLVLLHPTERDLEVRRLEIVKSPISIGRQPGNDLVISDPNVARVHCRLEQRGEAWWIVDEGSSGGIEVNGVHAAQRALADGDVISVGGHELRFSTSATRCPAAARLPGLQPERGEGSGRPVDPTQRGCLVLLRDLGPYPRGARFALSRSPALLGRVEGNDIVLASDSVSRRQCRFELREGAWWILDDASTGGTYVNDLHLDREQRLAPGDVIRAGGPRLHFLAGPRLEDAVRDEIHRLWTSDTLTSARSDGYFVEAYARARGRGAPFVLALAHVDGLVAIHADQGPLVADHVLAELVRILVRHLGPDDVLARRHDGTLALILPASGRADATGVCERLCASAAGPPFDAGPALHHLTLSVGLVAFEGESGQDLLFQAAENLEAARRGGPSRVVG